MAGLDEVLRRLDTDSDFRQQLEVEPAAALEGYDLSADDLTTLVDAVAADAPPEDQRPRRSAFFALVARRAAEERTDGPST